MATCNQKIPWLAEPQLLLCHHHTLYPHQQASWALQWHLQESKGCSRDPLVPAIIELCEDFTKNSRRDIASARVGKQDLHSWVIDPPSTNMLLYSTGLVKACK